MYHQPYVPSFLLGREQNPPPPASSSATANGGGVGVVPPPANNNASDVLNGTTTRTSQQQQQHGAPSAVPVPPSMVGPAAAPSVSTVAPSAAPVVAQPQALPAVAAAGAIYSNLRAASAAEVSSGDSDRDTNQSGHSRPTSSTTAAAIGAVPSKLFAALSAGQPAQPAGQPAQPRAQPTTSITPASVMAMQIDNKDKQLQAAAAAAVTNEAPPAVRVVSSAVTTATTSAAASADETSNNNKKTDGATSKLAAPTAAATSSSTQAAPPATRTPPPNTKSSSAATATRTPKSTPTSSKSKSKRQSTEATILESESKCLLGRIAARDSSMVSRRAFAYEPTLEIFKEYSFSDYVRGALLGVEGVVDWESSDEEEEDDEKEEVKGEGEEGLGDKTEKAEDGEGKEKHVEKEGVSQEEKQKEEEEASSPAAKEKGEEETTAATTSTLTAAPTPPAKKKEEKDLTPTRKSARQAARRARQRKKSDPLPPEQPARASARIKSRKEDTTAGSRCTDVSYAGKGSPSKAVTFDPFANMPEPNEMLLADGIAKITPPKGWWDHAGIGGDLTARGPIWSKGGRLGDMEVTTPIKQCASGIGGVYEYTMLELPPVPVHEFCNMADQYRKRQIGEEHSDDTSDEYMDTLARKFWKRLGPTMEPSVYGADMEGTLFDGADACGWNVDRLESALALLGADMDEEGAAPGEPAGRLPGVTTAYLYYGMWGSTFAAHTEDMNLLSINYLHAGAPKFWYAIDPRDSARFESLATSLFPAASRDCPDFLRHKRYLISPSILNKSGITYTTQVQRAGDAIITFPRSYHFGFNTGFNIAESTNFAVPEWLPYGKCADVCLCHPHSVRIDMGRFKDLLGQYEIRNARLRHLQRKRLTYSEFARAEAARRRREEESRYVSDEEDDEDEEEEPVRYGSIRPVEVVRMKTTSNTAAAISRRGKYKSKSAASKKKAASPREQWRRAKRAWPSSFRDQAHVLCFVPAAAENYDEDGQPSEKCFSGTVVDVCEGHVRIRWDGTSRKDDMWVKSDSLKLFIDDGPVKRDSDSEDEDEDESSSKKNKKKPAAKKRRVDLR